MTAGEHFAQLGILEHVQKVCSAYGVTMEQIAFSTERSRELTKARGHLRYLLHKAGWSYKTIADLHGLSDLKSVMDTVKRWERILAHTDPLAGVEDD